MRIILSLVAIIVGLLIQWQGLQMPEPTQNLTLTFGGVLTVSGLVVLILPLLLRSRS